MKRGNLLAIGVSCATVVAVTRAPGQTITDVGVLPGHTASSGWGINSDGTVVCGVSNNPNVDPPVAAAFRWTAGGGGGGMQNLGVLAGMNSSYGLGMSTDGTTVTGYCYHSGTSTISPAFRWTGGGGMQSLGLMPSGIYSEGMSVNADGTAIAGFGPGGGLYNMAFRWTTGGGYTMLGALPGGTQSAAYGISADGAAVTGYAERYIAFLNTPLRAFLWTPGGGMQDLGCLAGGNSSRGLAISADGGTVTGWSDGTAGLHPFRWHAGVMQDLGGTLGNWHYEGLAVSGDGSVIAGTTDSFSHTGPAFLWTQGTGMVDLNSYLATLGVNLSGWYLNECRGISGDGTALVGTGTHLGQTRGWVVRGLTTLCGPVIVQQPIDAGACVGGGGSLQIVAYPADPNGSIRYRWHKRVGGVYVPLSNGTTGFGTVISGATTPNLGFGNAALDAAGSYVCVVTAGCGTVQSVEVQVTLDSGPPGVPVTTAPVTVCPFGNAVFAVAQQAASNGPYGYLWEWEVAANVYVPVGNGTTTAWDGNKAGIGGIVSGAYQPIMTLAPDAGAGRRLAAVHTRRYRCVVSNACGAMASAGIVLTICEADQDCDGLITPADVATFINTWSNSLNNGGYYGDFDGDGQITPADVAVFISTWFAALGNGGC